jgi:predicted AlkP superfamily pyrophosphatase or phosphodiesterase
VRSSLWLAVASALLLATLAPRDAAASARPRLVLVLAVDQLRRDRVSAELPGGLGRLVREGRVYADAALAHALSETCPGHAVLLTGRHPGPAGIPGNRFFDLARGRSVYCAEDPAPGARVLGGTEGRSPRMLRVDALGDWMKAADPRSRVFAASSKDRSAIMLGGRGPDGVYWLQGGTHAGFTTSRYYRPDLPEWVQRFNGANPPRDGFWAALPDRWEHRPELVAPAADDAPGESSRFERTSGHPLRSSNAQRFIERLEATPYADEVLLDFAAALVREERLGEDATPDLLALSLSATDGVGHLYGPDSHEATDALERLDAALGRFLEALETRLRGDLLVALSADHGVLPLPESESPLRAQEDTCGVKGGRGSLLRVGFGLLWSVHWQVSPFGLPRAWLLFGGSQLAVDRPLAARRGVPVETVVRAARRQLETHPTIAHVWTREEIAAGDDELARLYRNSFDPERSGDLFVQVARGCLISWSSEGTGHGTPYLYDRAVPLVFWGRGVEPGRIEGPAASVDLGPTLARALGVSAPPDLDGRVLFRPARAGSLATTTRP